MKESPILKIQSSTSAAVHSFTVPYITIDSTIDVEFQKFCPRRTSYFRPTLQTLRVDVVECVGVVLGQTLGATEHQIGLAVRHQVRHRLAGSRDDHPFTALDGLKQLGQRALRLVHVHHGGHVTSVTG